MRNDRLAFEEVDSFFWGEYFDGLQDEESDDDDWVYRMMLVNAWVEERWFLWMTASSLDDWKEVV